MDEKTKNNVICGVFIILAIISGVCIWWNYTSQRTTNEYYNTDKSVEQAEARNRDAERRLESTQREIENAESRLDRADERTRNITDRAERDQGIIKECQDITGRMSERSEEIQRIIGEIEGRDKGNETQADGTKETT